MSPRRHRGAWAVTGLGALVFGLLLTAWTPSGDPRHGICLYRRLLDLPCPGCGLTRGLAHLAKGEWLAALELHPLAPLVALDGLVLWLFWGLWAWGRLAAPPLPVVTAVVLGQTALFVALWLGRTATGWLPW